MVPERTQPTTATIDLEQLLVRCMGNLEFAERILEIFQQRFDEDLDELDRMLASGDAAGVARLAHRLKGASANAAATVLQTRVAQIEQLARQESLEPVGLRLAELREEWAMMRGSLPLVGSAE